MTAQTILPANSVVDTGFATNSCRFDGSTSYMHKTPGSAGNTKLWTWSAWIKKSLPDGADLGIFGQYIDANNFFRIRYRSDQRLQVDNYTSGSATFSVILGSDNEHRDISAWYHLVVAYDSAQGTDSNRVKIYVNGVLQTVFQAATYPNQNVVTTLPVDGTRIELGRTTDNQFFNGYMAEVVLIDGTALAPTSFGESDSDSGIWVPIDVSGLTFGTNGFYLDFKNSANLGNDANGGTDLTEVGLAATDQSTDTCTNNFATLNPLDNFYLGGTFSEGNLKLSIDNSAVEAFTTSTIGVSSGKWYMENKIITTSSGRLYSGVVYGTAQATDDWPGGGSDQWFYRSEDGKVYNGGSEEYTGATLADDDIVGIALDLDNHKLYFSKNGAFQNSGDPTSGATGTGAIALDTGQTYFFAVGDSGSTAVVSSANFGSPAYAISSGNADANDHGNFEYAVPSGYFALNTKNLAEYG
tara:strand:+ start:170 stop:1573 length:1404 start_codon:yes stop_codon:yes gene_type:complete